ncbi:MAG: CRISPR-associated protein Cas4 [Promethearchaeota archaeon]
MDAIENKLAINLIKKHDGIMLTAEDLRQFMYCPRIIYFRYVLRIHPPETTQMQRGTYIHEKVARKFDIKRYQNTETYFNIWITSESLGFKALLDCFEFNGKEIYPVEFKTGTEQIFNKPPKHHEIQISAQAILLEEAFNMNVTKGIIKYIDAKKNLTINITIDKKLNVLNALKKIRYIIKNEDIPKKTINKNKCYSCEFWQYCHQT